MHFEKEPVKIVRIRYARTRLQHGIARLVLAVMCSMAANCSTGPVQQAPRGLDAIDHIIVIYAENRSFDNLDGLFPGVNGLANLTPEQNTVRRRVGCRGPRDGLLRWIEAKYVEVGAVKHARG
jgi:phospholipase C